MAVARPLAGGEVGAAAAVLARAFADDPLMRWAMPDDDRRRRGLAHVQGTVVRYCLRYGRVAAVDVAGRPAGIACWLPPGGTTVSPLRALRTGTATTPLHVGLRGSLRLLRFEQVAERVHREQAPEPHWYLYLLGVDPAAQGRGLATALLAPRLDEADRAGTPSYLETQTPGNRGLYERFGFRVVAGTVVAEGLRSWAMRRDPA